MVGRGLAGVAVAVVVAAWPDHGFFRAEAMCPSQRLIATRTNRHLHLRARMNQQHTSRALLHDILSPGDV